MPDKPIIMSAPMVRALLEGRKTQTRRVLPAPKSLQPNDAPTSEVVDYYGDGQLGAVIARGGVRTTSVIPLPFAPGDRLWVREALTLWPGTAEYAVDAFGITPPHMQAQHWIDNYAHATVPSIHMPRWASRLTLIVTDVRVERVQDISEEDADQEMFGGDFPHVVMPEMFDPQLSGNKSIPECFGIFWDSLHKPGFQWDDNVWVCAVSFETHHANIDALSEAA